jgi:hypothetical protein
MHDFDVLVWKLDGRIERLENGIVPLDDLT